MIRWASIFLLSLLLVACSPQKRTNRASNKIYHLTQRFPALLEYKDSTLFFQDTLFSKLHFLDAAFYDSALMQLQDSIVFKDSFQIVKIFRAEPHKIRFTALCLPDTQYLNRSIDFKFPHIRAQCNCKSEIRMATASLKKQRRRLLLFIILLAAAFGFLSAKKLKLW